MFYRNVYTPPTRKILIQESKIGSISSGFRAARENRLKYMNNPLIGYVNTNSLRNKVIDLREIILELSLDYYVLSETKIDQSFPTGQFYIKGYEVRDRDKYGGQFNRFC